MGAIDDDIKADTLGILHSSKGKEILLNNILQNYDLVIIRRVLTQLVNEGLIEIKQHTHRKISTTEAGFYFNLDNTKLLGRITIPKGEKYFEENYQDRISNKSIKSLSDQIAKVILSECFARQDNMVEIIENHFSEHSNLGKEYFEKLIRTVPSVNVAVMPQILRTRIIDYCEKRISELEQRSLDIRGNKITVTGVQENYRNTILWGLENKFINPEDVKEFLISPFKLVPARTVDIAELNIRLSQVEGQFSMLVNSDQLKILAFISKFIEQLIIQVSKPSDSKDSKSEEEEKPIVNSYWILKLSHKYWGAETFKVGIEAFFNTHNFEKQKRPEYELFLNVKINDLVIGYDFSNYNAVVCIFRVTKGVHQDSSYGEVINLVFEKVLLPPIPLSTFRKHISFANELGISSPVRLISITEEIYNNVLGDRNSQEEKKANSIYLQRSSFAITDSVEPVIGVKSIAKEIAGLIRNLNSNDVGKMIGIFGNWGRGKTFMVEQVWNVLKESEPGSDQFVRINFHAWKYQDTNASWAYMYEAFVKKYFEKNPEDKRWWITKKLVDIRKRFRLNRFRHGSWPLVRFIITLLVIVVAGYVSAKVVSEAVFKGFWLFLTTAGIIDGVRQVIKYFEDFKMKGKAREVFSKYFNKPTFKELLGIQSEIQGELRHLLECWLLLEKGEPGKRILLFVDDIDRCSEERIIQLIDALRVMLEDEEISKRVIVIAAIDERVLKRAIKWKYKALLDADKRLDAQQEWESATLNITSEYMDKLFLASIKLGTLTSQERVDIYKQFSNGKVSLEDVQPEKLDEISVASQSESLSNNISSPINEKAVKVSTEEEETVFGNPYLDTIFGVSPERKQEPTVEVKKTEGFELSYLENQFLIELISNLADATPRQIRIFYYRYMLARNLLTAALLETNQENRFNIENRNQLLGRLLVHYTGLRSNSELIQDRKELMKKKKVNIITSSEYIAGIEDDLITEVMDVLEMVIAY